jgi:hypothetical protein
MTAEFFSTANSTFTSYEVTDSQIQTLKECIEGTISTDEAAKQITAHPEASSTPVEIKQRLGGLWTLLNDTAVALPSAQPKIISLLQTIRTLPKAREPHGEGEGCVDLEDGYYWRELTDWASNWADSFNFHASNYSIEACPNEQEKARRKLAWINACAYSARLATTGDEALSSYGAGLERAHWAISDALEHDSRDEEPGSLEAAAQVFLYAASELYRRCKEGPKEGIPNKKDVLWKGEKGFSLERWGFWRERWSVFAKSEGLSHEARGVAQKAFDAMKEVEDE